MKTHSIQHQNLWVQSTFLMMNCIFPVKVRQSRYWKGAVIWYWKGAVILWKEGKRKRLTGISEIDGYQGMRNFREKDLK